MKTNVREFDSTSAVNASDAAHLLGLIGINETTPSTWQREDMAAIFRHQMSAPLDFDLSGEVVLGTATIAALHDLPNANQSGIATFGDLFRHPQPPLGPLKLCKSFFKRTVGLQPKDSPEHQVAYQCYLLTLAVARLRHGQRITNLSDKEFLKGLNWALKQHWVDNAIRTILLEAWSVFSAK